MGEGKGRSERSQLGSEPITLSPSGLIFGPIPPRLSFTPTFRWMCNPNQVTRILAKMQPTKSFR
jgi:hypothetical protein